MPKFAAITLQEITYSGENIGKNLEFRFSIAGVIEDLNSSIQFGETRGFRRVLTFRDVEELQFPFLINTEVVERDPVFNDLGSGSIEVKSSDLIADQLAMKSVQITVPELSLRGRQKAVFDIKFTVELDSGVRFVSDVEPDGWLKIRFSSGSEVAVPNMLSVQLTKREQDREHFIVNEGEFFGKEGSVTLRPDGESYLMKTGLRRAAADVKFNRSGKVLFIHGLGTIAAETDPSDPAPTGTFELEIPASSHVDGRIYSDDSRYATTWFRIGHEGGRFLHVGNVSAGCITVTERSAWTRIYTYLISSRKDHKSVGQIEIT